MTEKFCCLASENVHHESEKISKMSALSKLCYVAVELILLGVAGLIIFRTVNDVGLVLYTLHPVLMSVGVSATSFKAFLVSN